MIVKNEEEVLARCLASVKGFPDETIIIDTGSTDKTVEIAESFGAKIFHFEWIQDFAAARNFSFSKGTQDYLFWLDADDVITPDNLAKLQALKPNLTAPQYVMWYDYSQDIHGRSEMMLPRERLMKRECNFRWKYPIHECINLNKDYAMTDIVITHRRTNAGVASDLGRNIVMLEKAIGQPEYQDDARIHYYLAKECLEHDQVDKAVRWFEKFLTMSGGWWEDKLMAYGKLTQAYLRWSQKEEDPTKKQELQQKTQGAAFRAIGVDHRIAEPYYILGMLAWDLKQWATAAHWFEICGSLEKPDLMSPLGTDIYTWLPHIQATVMYYNVGNFVKANWHNEEAAKFVPNDSRIEHNRKLLHELLHPKKEPKKVMKLNLGSGNKRYKDYISCDLFPGKEVDEVFGLQEIPYADNTIDAIHSEHALEHLWHQNARAALREWYRVLKPGGELHLQIPDLKHCCEKYVDAINKGDQRLANWYRWTIYGAQISQSDEPPEGQIHYTGFSLEELRRELTGIGFVISSISNYVLHDTPSIEVQATKPNTGVKIGWVTAGASLEVPQYRIRTHNVNRWLQSKGYASQIIDSSRIGEFDVLVFDDVYRQEGFDNITRAKEMGKRVIVNICEDWFGFENQWYSKCIALADTVITCSPALTEKVKAHELNSNVMDIEDAIESDMRLNCEYQERKLRVGWVGMGGNAVHAEKLRPIIEKCGYELVTIHEHANATIKWDLNTWQQELAKCDIAIAPCDYVNQPCKSNNKVTTYMALGLPIICSPLPAYTRLIRTGVNGFVANNDAEWEQYLTILKDAEVRRRIGQAGKQIARAYHLDLIAGYWRDLLIKSQANSTIAVDIIVPTYDNPQYLEQCIESIKACTDVPYNIIVIDAKKEGTNFSQSMNLGIKRGSAPYICFLNDDVIVSKGWIKPLIEQIKGKVAFSNPLSNCDKGWLHNYDLRVDGISLLPGAHKIGSINPKSIHNFKSGSIKTYTRPWVAFFATMTSREIVEKIGLFDEEFKTGSEDLDYCTRANKLGYTCAINEASFVFHYGGVSRKAHEDENHAKHQEEDRYNQARIKFKYDKPLIVIHSGLAWSNWDARTLYTEGLGGSETWAIRMSEEFAKLGCRVVCFGPMQDEIYNGVEWKNQSKWESFLDMNWIDVCVVSRYPQFLENKIRAGKKYLMVHDVFPMNDNGLTKKHIESGNINGVLCLSTWHRDYVSQVCGISKDKIILIKNGVDLQDFQL